MRITKLQLTKPQAVYVKELTEEKNEAINPQTKKPVSIDFSKDLFAILETLNPHKVIKDSQEIGDEVRDGYIKHKLTDYYKIQDHYNAIRRFIREFTHTRLYRHLQGLNNPEKALEILLDMFSPPPPKPPQGKPKPQEAQGQGQGKSKGQNSQSQNKPQDGQNNGQKQGDKEQDEDNKNQQKKGNKEGQENEQENQDEEEENQDQNKPEEKDKPEEPEEMDDTPENEISNTPPDPLLDIEKFKEDMPAMEEMLRDNVLEDELMRSVVEEQAGVGHNELTTIEGLAKNIKKIASAIRNKNFEILDVARKFDITEQYVREEEIKDVDYPEKDWRITNIKTLSDFPNILPYQFLYPNEIFDKMLMDKDLKTKQYQSRRKKKQILYLLVDVSGSMDGARQVVATSIAVAYIKKAISEKSIYFFRFFDDKPFELHKVTNEQEAIKEVNYLLKNPKSGGGTNIDQALRRAIKDINDPNLLKQENQEFGADEGRNALDAEVLYERADILIITDGGDDVSVTAEELRQNKIILHTFLIEGSNPTLKSISKSFQNLTQNDINKLIN